MLALMEGMEERDAYTPTEASRIMARTTGKPITERRIRQMLQSGELEGFRDEAGRWHVLQSEVHRLRDERRTGSQEPPGGPQNGAELLEVVRSLERERGRLEARLELEERAESTLREERDRLIAELDAERAERQRLAEQLEAERRRGFWSRLFGG
jgi:chromosome segregation ATPase